MRPVLCRRQLMRRGKSFLPIKKWTAFMITLVRVKTSLLFYLWSILILINYVPLFTSPDFPPPLAALHKHEYESLNYTDFLEVCTAVEISNTESESLAIEKQLLLSFKSKLWFKYHAGRITASCMKAACHTDHSLNIKSICYPDQFCLILKNLEYIFS